MLALTDTQLEQVKQAATLLPPHDRDAFLRLVANRLDYTRQQRGGPTDGDVAGALAYVLGLRGLAAGTHTFLVDSIKEQFHASIQRRSRRRT